MNNATALHWRKIGYERSRGEQLTADVAGRHGVQGAQLTPHHQVQLRHLKPPHVMHAPLEYIPPSTDRPTAPTTDRLQQVLGNNHPRGMRQPLLCQQSVTTRVGVSQTEEYT